MRARQSSVIVLLIAAVWCGSAAAQEEPIPQGEFNVMRYTPAPGPRNYFQVEGAQTPGDLTGSVGLVLDYAHLPFVLWNASCEPDGSDCMVDDTRAELVQYVAAAHITGTFTIANRLQIGAVIPLVITSGEAFMHSTGEDPIEIPGGTAFALADPRLTIKGNIFTDASSGFGLGATAFVTFPTGQAIASNRYVGDGLPTFGGWAIAEIVNSGVHAAVNVGGMWREDTDLFSTHVGPQLTYSAAFGYDLAPFAGLYAEIVGASSFSAQVDEHWLEWRAGGRLRIDDFEFQLAGGTGIVSGVGTPLFRVIGGLQWAPMHMDSDGDGVDDTSDACPSESEDSDDFEQEDGCPEEDNDDDGRPDDDDPCPDEAEDTDEHEDEDGCPDRDNDGDGVQDGYDSCPNVAEDRDDDRDEDGCPEADRDRDGIEDANDQCADQGEDFDGYGDEDGCPEEDFDSDSVSDENDQCPDQAEDADDFEDEDGCAEDGGPPPGQRRRGR